MNLHNSQWRVEQLSDRDIIRKMFVSGVCGKNECIYLWWVIICKDNKWLIENFTKGHENNFEWFDDVLYKK